MSDNIAVLVSNSAVGNNTAKCSVCSSSREGFPEKDFNKTLSEYMSSDQQDSLKNGQPFTDPDSKMHRTQNKTIDSAQSSRQTSNHKSETTQNSPDSLEDSSKKQKDEELELQNVTQTLTTPSNNNLVPVTLLNIESAQAISNGMSQSDQSQSLVMQTNNPHGNAIPMKQTISSQVQSSLTDDQQPPLLSRVNEDQKNTATNNKNQFVSVIKTEESELSLSTKPQETNPSVDAFGLADPSQIANGTHNEVIKTTTINTPMHSSSWDTDIAHHVLTLRHNGTNLATLLINPDHLGPIQVTIAIDAQSVTNIQFATDNPMVRSALSQALPTLVSLFESSGIELGNTSVGSQAQSSPNEPQQQEHHRRSKSDQPLAQANESNEQLATINNLVNMYV